MTQPFCHDDPVSLTTDQLETLVAFSLELQKIAADVILPHFRTALEMEDKKGYDFFDPVTEADRAAEAAMRKEINARFPDHSIFGEEYGHEENASPLTWTIDPIDGTRAFVLGMTGWGSLLALHDGQKPVIGTLGQPYLEEVFLGAPGLGRAELLSRRGNRKLQTRDPGALDNASLTSTHPSMFPKGPKWEAYNTLLGAVRQNGYGGDCYAYGLVALGTHDLVVEDGLSAYDIQAIIPIIEAAGGCVTSCTGERADLGGSALAAGNPRIHAEALEILHQGFAG